MLAQLHAVLVTRLVHDGATGCQIYHGPHWGEYGSVKKTVNGQKYRMYAHRVAKLYSLGVVTLPEGMQCSHRCHRSRCCNPQHIVAERQGCNNQRQNCKTRRQCSGHVDPVTGAPLPDCLFF